MYHFLSIHVCLCTRVGIFSNTGTSQNKRLSVSLSSTRPSHAPQMQFVCVCVTHKSCYRHKCTGHGLFSQIVAAVETDNRAFWMLSLLCICRSCSLTCGVWSLTQTWTGQPSEPELPGKCTSLQSNSATCLMNKINLLKAFSAVREINLFALLLGKHEILIGK